jgi:type II secretory ATPase GspE/PulE/Tfp pilus assembly ATPase PilB-like protein
MIRHFPASHEPYDGSVEHEPFVKLWHGLIADAIRRGYEHIHLFPSPSALSRPADSLAATFTIRVYTHGEWQELLSPTIKMYSGVLRRLKVMASFGMARRMPLERGRFRYAFRSAIHEIEVTVRIRPDGWEEAMVDVPRDPIEPG